MPDQPAAVLHSSPVPARPKVPAPVVRPLKVYAIDPSAGNFVGNRMTVEVRWEPLQPGPAGSKVVVVDYDPVQGSYYTPVDLEDPAILIRGGLDPTESDPRFHQQMVYAVVMATVEKFEAALGRKIHWHRAERIAGADCQAKLVGAADDIWVLHLFPHAMLQANAFYSREAQGILFGYFTASRSDPGHNLPGQRVFTCLSYDVIAHETTHAVIDGIRSYFTEPTNPDVLAFHEGYADLAALFQHFSHREALLDTVRKTGGRLFDLELQPDMAPPAGGSARISGQLRQLNPLIQLARQFGESRGGGHGLRSALGTPPTPKDIETRVDDPHFRGSILVAAVFDAYFTIYAQRTANLFRIYRAGGGSSADDLPGPLASLLADAAARLADDFFLICARALDYCPPVDLRFGDFLRALITVDADLRPADTDVRDALMQAFRLRGIYAEDAAFFSEDALRWPELTEGELPPFEPVEVVVDPASGRKALRSLVFGNPNGLTRAEKDTNGQVLRHYARVNAQALGLDPTPGLEAAALPQVPSFHPTFRIAVDGSLRQEMVVEVVQTRRVPFDPALPRAGSFPLRGGATLIVSAPEVVDSRAGKPHVRYAIRKPLVGADGTRRSDAQRDFAISTGLANGDTDDARHFQVDFNLLHRGF